MSAGVSAIVCTYNRCESLRQTLQALAGQALQPGLAMEILVVDNNSTDRTREVIEEAARQSRWPIRYLFEPRQGKTHALNHGIREARGELLVFTDDDAIPEARWAQALWDDAALLQADCLGGRIAPRWVVPPPAWLLPRRDLLLALALLDLGPAPKVATIHEAYFVFGVNMACRRRLFDDVGLFRTDLGPQGRRLSRGDDTELVVRAFQAGKRVAYTPRAVVHHLVPPDRVRKSYFRRWKFETGRSEAVLEDDLARGAPRWLVRRCLEDGTGALWDYGRGRADQGLTREMAFWHRLGQLVGAWGRGRHRAGH